MLVLEAGRPDSLWDVFIHMPAALAFPIGSRFYDWRYESEPEPFMHGRRIYHARGKVLGGSSSVNGMIFQRGNPLDYERWARRPGHGAPGTTRTACPTSSAWRPASRRRRTIRSAARTGRSCSSAARRAGPLFDAFFAAVQEAGHPLTDDVNGYRQEGFAAFDRNVHRGRRLSAARAYLHPVMSRPNLDVVTLAQVSRDPLRRHARDRRRVRPRAPRPHRVEAGEVMLCGGAINSPQLLQLSGRRRRGRAARARDRRRRRPARASGRTCRTTSRSTSSTPCTQPVSMAPYFAMRNRPRVGAEWLLRKTGPGATNHFEAGGFVRSNDDVAYPNLMFHFLPIAVRYDGTLPRAAAATATRSTSGRCTPTRAAPSRSSSADPRAKPALRFNYLSTEQDRREWVEAIRVTRAILGAPAFAPFSGGELSPGPAVETDEQVLDWVARDAETALHPSCTARMGTGDGAVVDPRHDARARRRRPARRRRVRVPLRHQRQHLRAGDDDRGEGGRPDPRRHAAAARAGGVLPPPPGVPAG